MPYCWVVADSDLLPRRAQRRETPSKGDLRERALLDAARRLLEQGTFADVSVAEIARQHECSRQAIMKRAKRNGWTQDLSAAVVKEAAAQLQADAVTGTVTPVNAREIITAAAARSVEVVRQHRAALRRLSLNQTTLVERFESMIGGMGNIKELGDAQAVQESMARTLAKIVPLERQAFGLDAKDDAQRDTDMPDDQLDARIAHLLRKT